MKMSRNAYAAYRGVHRATVSKWFARGAIDASCVAPTGEIIVERADALLAERIDPTRLIAARSRRQAAFVSARSRPAPDAVIVPAVSELAAFGSFLELMERELALVLTAENHLSTIQAFVMVHEALGTAWPMLWCKLQGLDESAYLSVLPPKIERKSLSPLQWEAIAALRDDASPFDGQELGEATAETWERVSHVIRLWSGRVWTAWGSGGGA